MKIAIIGSGNVGGALAQGWAKAGHQILLGVRDISKFKGESLADLTNVRVYDIAVAVAEAEVIVIAAPASVAAEIARSLGNTTGKIIIDTMNALMIKPEGFSNTADAILSNTKTRDVVKCFNTTGFENILNPKYGDEGVDMYVAGDSERGRAAAVQLALDLGFSHCHDFGGNNRFDLIEQLAFCWINLAIMQKQGRNMAFKIVRR